MNVTLDIPLDLEEQCRIEAREHGMSVDEVISRALMARQSDAFARRRRGLSGAEIADLMATSPHRDIDITPSREQVHLKLRDIGF